MQLSALSVAATLGAVGANAFLIPISVTLDEGKKDANEDSGAGWSRLSPTIFSDPKHRLIHVDCNRCLPDGSDGSLIYDLTATELGKPRFLINGGDFTPADLTLGGIFSGLAGAASYPASVKIPLVEEVGKEDLSIMDFTGTEVEVRYNMFTEQHLADDGGEVIKVVFEPTSVDGRWMMIGQTKELEISLAKEKKGGFVIVDVKQNNGLNYLEDFPIIINTLDGLDGLDVGEGQFEIVDGDADKEVLNILTDWLGTLEGWGKKAGEKVSSWGEGIGRKLGCHSSVVEDVTESEEADESEESEITDDVTGGNTLTGTDDEIDIEFLPIKPSSIPPSRSSNSGRPKHYGRPHHHHHGHYMQPPMEQDEGITLYKIFTQVFWPIAVGVAAGMAVSLVGMVIGHLVMIAWYKIRGRPLPSEACKRQNMDSEGEAGKGLLSEESYSDAPPEYEAGEEEDVVEKQ